MQSLEAAVEEADNLLYRSKKYIPSARRSEQFNNGKQHFSLFEKLSELKREERLSCFKKRLKTEEQSSAVLSDPHLIEKLVIKERLNTFVVCLHANNEGYTFAVKSWNDNETVYENISEEMYPALEDSILDYIDNGHIPPMLSDLLEEIQPPVYYGGCIIAEIWDCRCEDRDDYKPYHVLLKPTLQTIVNDVNIIAENDEDNEWKLRDKLALESMLILANNGPLCLSPNSGISVAMDKLNSSKNVINQARLKHIARKYTARAIYRKNALMAHAKLPSPLRYLYAFITDKKQQTMSPVKEEERELDNTTECPQPSEVPDSVWSDTVTEIVNLSHSEPKSLEVFGRPVDSSLKLVEQYILHGEDIKSYAAIKLSIYQRSCDAEYVGEISYHNEFSDSLLPGTSATAAWCVPNESPSTSEGVSENKKGDTLYEEINLKPTTSVTRFPLGSRVFARRYLTQFIDIVTEQGKNRIQMTVITPGHPAQCITLTSLQSSDNKLIPVDSTLPSSPTLETCSWESFYRSSSEAADDNIEYVNKLLVDAKSILENRIASRSKLAATAVIENDAEMNNPSISQQHVNDKLQNQRRNEHQSPPCDQQGITLLQPEEILHERSRQLKQKQLLLQQQIHAQQQQIHAQQQHTQLHQLTQQQQHQLTQQQLQLTQQQLQLTQQHQLAAQQLQCTPQLQFTKQQPLTYQQTQQQQQQQQITFQQQQQQQQVQIQQEQQVQKQPEQQQHQQANVQLWRRRQLHAQNQLQNQLHLIQSSSQLQTENERQAITKLKASIQEHRQMQATSNNNNTNNSGHHHHHQKSGENTSSTSSGHHPINGLVPSQSIPTFASVFSKRTDLPCTSAQVMLSSPPFSSTVSASSVNVTSTEQQLSMHNIIGNLSRFNVAITESNKCSQQQQQQQQSPVIANNSAILSLLSNAASAQSSSSSSAASSNITLNSLLTSAASTSRTPSHIQNYQSSNNTNTARQRIFAKRIRLSTSSKLVPSSAFASGNNSTTTTTTTIDGNCSSAASNIDSVNNNNNNNNNIDDPVIIIDDGNRGDDLINNTVDNDTTVLVNNNNNNNNNNNDNHRKSESIIIDDFNNKSNAIATTTPALVTSQQQPFVHVSISSLVKQLDQQLASNQRLHTLSKIIAPVANIKSGSITAATTASSETTTVINNNLHSNTLSAGNSINNNYNNNNRNNNNNNIHISNVSLADLQSIINIDRNNIISNNNNNNNVDNGKIRTDKLHAITSSLGLFSSNNNNNNTNNNTSSVASGTIGGNTNNNNNNNNNNSNNTNLGILSNSNNNNNTAILQTLPSPSVAASQNILQNSNTLQQLSPNSLRSIISGALTSPSSSGSSSTTMPTSSKTVQLVDYDVSSCGSSSSNTQSLTGNNNQLINSSDCNKTRLVRLSQSMSNNASSSASMITAYLTDPSLSNGNFSTSSSSSSSLDMDVKDGRHDKVDSETVSQITKPQFNSTIVNLAEIVEVASALKHVQVAGTISALPNSIGTPVILTTASRGERSTGNLKSGLQKGGSNAGSANSSMQNSGQRGKSSQSPKQNAIQSLLTSSSKVTIPPNAVVQPGPPTPVQNSTLALAAQQQLQFILQKQALQQMHLNNNLNTSSSHAPIADNSSSSQISSRNLLTPSIKVATKRRRLSTVSDN